MLKTTHGIYVMGGSEWTGEDYIDRSEVLHLECPGDQIQTCQWKEMPEKLEAARSFHVSILLPESSDICD